jgi:hypothetical protein
MMQRIAMATLLVAGLSPTAVAANEVATRVVVLLDTSGSFTKQAPAAGEKLVQLFEDWSKQRVARGSRSRDELELIALDASPDVVYRATLGDIKKSGPAEWRALIAARNGYAGCTDVEAGFFRAAEIFCSQPATAANYLVVASDLIDEPIDPKFLTRSGSGQMRCLPARFAPPAGMPWQDLVRMGVKGFITWLPTNQTIIWKKALAGNGLGDAIRVLDSFESGVQSLPPPRRSQPEAATPIIPPSEVGGAVAGMARGAVSGILWAAVIGAAVIGIAAGYGIWRRRRQGSEVTAPVPMPAGTAPRPVTGPVAPLRLNRRMNG